MRKIRWFIINALYGYGMYAAFILGIEGAENIVITLAWVMFALSFVCFTDTFKERVIKEGRTIPVYIDIPFDVLIACVFLYFGAIATGIAWFLQMLFQQSGYASALGDR